MKPEYFRNNMSRYRFRLRSLLCAFILCLTAVSAFGEDIQTVSEDSRQLSKQAEKLIKRGKLNEAEKIFRRVVELNPDNSAAKLRLAYIYVKQRRLVESYKISFEIANAEPKNSDAFAVLGASFLGVGKFKEARLMFISSLQINKKQALAWAGLGMLDFYENKIGESLENLREAVYRDPQQPDYLFALAQVSARAEKYKEAAEAYYRFLYISKDTDDERRTRIKGLINFLRFLGQKEGLYTTSGAGQAKVPIKVVGNRPIIELKINDRDRPFNFVLDTGSGISVISDETAKALGIDPITKGGFAKGIGGDGKFEIVYGFVRQVDIGQVQINNVPVYIRKFHSVGSPVDGYIGLSLISKFLTTLDYGNLSFSLAKPSANDNAGADLKPEETSLSMPLRLTSSGFLSGEVQLEGVEAPLNFIVDTGASISVISDHIANLEGITPFARDERMRVIGSAGITEDVPSFLLPSVSFGQHTRSGIAAIALNLNLINEASGFEQAGILGGNFLMNYSMTFDFRNSKVTFTPNAK